MRHARPLFLAIAASFWVGCSSPPLYSADLSVADSASTASGLELATLGDMAIMIPGGDAAPDQAHLALDASVCKQPGMGSTASCNACFKAHCDALMSSCYGRDWVDGYFDGTCRTYGDCACHCQTPMCDQNCLLNSGQACITCAMAAGECLYKYCNKC